MKKNVLHVTSVVVWVFDEWMFWCLAIYLFAFFRALLNFCHLWALSARAHSHKLCLFLNDAHATYLAQARAFFFEKSKNTDGGLSPKRLPVFVVFKDSDNTFYHLLSSNKNIITCFWLLSCWLDSGSCVLLFRCRNICSYRRRCGRNFNGGRDTREPYLLKWNKAKQNHIKPNQMKRNKVRKKLQNKNKM